MKAAMPPRRWASEMTWRARVVLPEDSGPKISTTRPRGNPPTPRAASSESAPVGMAGTSIFSRLPSRMIEPLPNCLSIWASAASIAFARSFLSSAIDVSFVLFVFAATGKPRADARILLVGVSRGGPVDDEKIGRIGERDLSPAGDAGGQRRSDKAMTLKEL